MSTEGQKIIETAVRLGLIAEKQAATLREEAAMFPGQNMATLLLKRQVITTEQLLELQKAMAGRKASSGATENTVPPPSVPKGSRLEMTGPPKPGFSWQAAPANSGVTPAPPKPGPPPPPKPGGTQAPAIGPAVLSANPPDISSVMMAAPAKPLIGMKAPVSTGLPKPEVNWSLPDYLVMGRKNGCSDLHLTPGRPPFVRRRGEIHYLDAPPLTAERSEQLNFSALSEEQRAVVREHLQFDFALEIPAVGRHRCNIFRQRLGWEGAYRIIRAEIPTMEELHLPPVLRTLTTYHQGLVLVTGPAGSGKTTTVASMLDYINRTREDHIITVEDPIEYVIKPQKCQITQREVGSHTGSFASALRAALRQDPDVILVGELRDLETTAIAISAAETGHLVFATLHTSSAARTIGRLLEVYPAAQRQQISTMVADSLRGVISQQLISRRDRNIPALAMEVLLFTSGVAQQVRDGRTHQLVSLMQSGKRIGMKTMDDSLMELMQAGSITGYEAYTRADNKPPFEPFKAVK